MNFFAPLRGGAALWTERRNLAKRHPSAIRAGRRRGEAGTTEGRAALRSTGNEAREGLGLAQLGPIKVSQDERTFISLNIS
jgi:hypothetical protein